MDDTNTWKVDASSPAKSNTLDTIKLDKALGLAKKKSKDGQVKKANNICTETPLKFLKNKQTLTILQVLVE